MYFVTVILIILAVVSSCDCVAILGNSCIWRCVFYGALGTGIVSFSVQCQSFFKVDFSVWPFYSSARFHHVHSFFELVCSLLDYQELFCRGDYAYAHEGRLVVYSPSLPRLPPTVRPTGLIVGGGPCAAPLSIPDWLSWIPKNIVGCNLNSNSSLRQRLVRPAILVSILLAHVATIRKCDAASVKR